MRVDKYGRVRIGVPGYRIEVRRKGIKVFRRYWSCVNKDVEELLETSTLFDGRKAMRLVEGNWKQIMEAVHLLAHWSPSKSFPAPAIHIPPHMRAVQ